MLDKTNRSWMHWAVVVVVAMILAVAVTWGILQRPLTPFLRRKAPATINRTTNTSAFFTTTHQLYDAVDAYVAAVQEGTVEVSDVAFEYGYPMGTWDVSRLTNFSRVFDPARTQVLYPARPFEVFSSFNEDLSGWDVSNAATMSGMFASAESFEGIGVEAWNVAKVTNFSYMFAYAYSFNGNVSTWNTSSATDMSALFQNAQVFTGDVSRFDVLRVESMSFMFYAALQFNTPDLTQWDVSNVRSMDNIFGLARLLATSLLGTRAVLKLWPEWYVGFIKDEINNKQLSHNAIVFLLQFWSTNFNGDLSRWRVENVESMSHMFYRAKLFEGGNLTGWNTSSVTDMSGMFGEGHAFIGDTLSWDVSKVVDFSGSFAGCFMFNGDVSRWNTSSAASMDGMFANAISFQSNISLWDTSKVQTTRQMFYNTVNFNSDVSAWSLSSVIDASGMFHGASLFDQSLCRWEAVLPSDTNVTLMFHATACLDTSDPIFGSSSPTFCGPCE